MVSQGRHAGPVLGFNPLWLLDFAGMVAAALFIADLAFGVAAPAGLGFAFARETALAIVALAVAARLVDASARRRMARAQARADVGRRLDLLDDALMELRRALSREAARQVFDARAVLAATAEAQSARLDRATRDALRSCLAACEVITGDLANTVPQRAAITSRAYRLSQEIGRAGRRGELDPYAAGDLNALIEDALGVMDEALYAEWNADHFGRLGAVQRHFARRIERRDGEVARRIDGEAAELFDQLIAHVREKVALLDRLAAWSRDRESLQFALTGAPPRARRRPDPPSAAARFVVAPRSGSRTMNAAPLHLPAAND